MKIKYKIIICATYVWGAWVYYTSATSLQPAISVKEVKFYNANFQNVCVLYHNPS